MNNICDIQSCVGCMACKDICPKNAINTVMDEKGFYRPYIEKDRCIGCGRCETICPVNNVPLSENNTTVYAYQHDNDDIRFNSTSGGFFTKIAEYVFLVGGIVCGAAYTDNMKLEHIFASTMDELAILRKSKYVQSDMTGVYKKVKEYLMQGKILLFVGLPCQVAALHNYLGKRFTNLILIDLVCYGVPSPGLYMDWIEYLKSKDLQPKNIIFRDKSYGYATSNVRIELKNGKNIENKRDTDVYSNLFFKNLTIRESCFECKYKSINRISDITLGDLWLVKYYIPKMDDNKGTTAVFIHSNKGRELCERLKLIKLDLNKVLSLDARKLTETVKRSKAYDEFWNDYKRMNFIQLIDKYEPMNGKYILKKLFKEILNNTGISRYYFKYKKRQKVSRK